MTVSDYHFKHTGIMKNAMQSIPAGNGDLGVNVWADKDGLWLLLSKTDAWSELHRLLKTGLIKLNFTPNPFGRFTKWQLSYAEGALYIRAKDVSIRIYVDANAPIYHIHYSSRLARSAKMEIVNYRRCPMHLAPNDHSNYHMMSDGPVDCDCVESADCIFSKTDHTVGQYHHNDTSCYDFTLKHQGLDSFDEKNDPLLGRTFGFLAHSDQMHAENGCLRADSRTEFDLDIVSYTAQCETAEWIKTIYDLANNIKTDFDKHKEYWDKMWRRCWVEIKSGRKARFLTERFIAQRYMNICAGRGDYPIKFNGSIFTNQPSPHVKQEANYDFRQWGGPYWFQNTRLVYWSLLYCGDYELMKPFFNLYLDAMPLAKYRTREYFGHDGIFYPETLTIFGAYTNKDYGWDRDGKEACYIPNPYVRYYHVGALELCKMMLVYADYAGDRAFLRDEALPFAHEVLVFYRNHFGIKNGKLYFYPSASLETWHDCADDTPTIAGLLSVANDILNQAEASEPLKALCAEIKSLLPEIPTQVKSGKTVIAPMHENMDKVRKNVENPELYTVFPFSLYGMGKENLQMARDTFALRDIKESGGWQQHGVQAALLGLTKKAEKELFHNSRNTNKKCIFPAFWGPNYDWLPDQDNGANFILTLTKMLLQCDGDTVRIFPAWDFKKRNVSFRLPIDDGNFIEVSCAKGRITYKLDRETSKRIVLPEHDSKD